jgi:hypothetical protein
VLRRQSSLSKQAIIKNFRLSISLPQPPGKQAEQTRKPQALDLSDETINGLHEEAANYFFSNFSKVTEKAIEKESKRNRKLNNTAQVPKSLKQIKEEKEAEFMLLARQKLRQDLSMNNSYCEQGSEDLIE